ncbi:hypothetical protein K488DRAFT_91863 [Vararia minispora EC-137]|uniref:Uncharacterized protein n=1 Tax=Vararia minispora EC-137 TaxID=1314806 RepID=A0ACB8Q4S9_9AGAM|nr:hypothetical protein K488DRAFT_91863 [Vararia minispora EC-137]
MVGFISPARAVAAMVVVPPALPPIPLDGKMFWLLTSGPCLGIVHNTEDDLRQLATAHPSQDIRAHGPFLAESNVQLCLVLHQNWGEIASLSLEFSGLGSFCGLLPLFTPLYHCVALLDAFHHPTGVTMHAPSLPSAVDGPAKPSNSAAPSAAPATASPTDETPSPLQTSVPERPGLPPPSAGASSSVSSQSVPVASPIAEPPPPTAASQMSVATAAPPLLYILPPSTRRWVVHQGALPGIFSDVDVAQSHVRGISNALMRRYCMPEEAVMGWHSFRQRLGLPYLDPRFDPVPSPQPALPRPTSPVPRPSPSTLPSPLGDQPSSATVPGALEACTPGEGPPAALIDDAIQRVSDRRLYASVIAEGSNNHVLLDEWRSNPESSGRTAPGSNTRPAQDRLEDYSPLSQIFFDEARRLDLRARALREAAQRERRYFMVELIKGTCRPSEGDFTFLREKARVNAERFEARADQDGADSQRLRDESNWEWELDVRFGPFPRFLPQSYGTTAPAAEWRRSSFDSPFPATSLPHAPSIYGQWPSDPRQPTQEPTPGSGNSPCGTVDAIPADFYTPPSSPPSFLPVLLGPAPPAAGSLLSSYNEEGNTAHSGDATPTSRDTAGVRRALPPRDDGGVSLEAEPFARQGGREDRLGIAPARPDVSFGCGATGVAPPSTLVDARSLWAPALQEPDALFEYAGMGLRRRWNLENARTGPSRPRPSPIVRQPQAHQVGAEDAHAIDLDHAGYARRAWEGRASEICEDKKGKGRALM